MDEQEISLSKSLRETSRRVASLERQLKATEAKRELWEKRASELRENLRRSIDDKTADAKTQLSLFRKTLTAEKKTKMWDERVEALAHELDEIRAEFAL